MKGGIDMDFASFDSQEMPGGGWVVKNHTIYVNPYFVYNGDGYIQDHIPDRFTKHYYAGSERIASRLNREGQSANAHNALANIYTPAVPDQPYLNDLRAVLTAFGMNDQLDSDPAPYPEIPIQSEADCYEIFNADQLEYERCLCLHFPAEAALQSIECYSYEPIYWYHPDYLGHTDFVTDRTGQPYQHFFYAPFGEALLSQHTGTGYYNTPYRFNAKELDSETGLIYYGARYYEPKESVWLSLDPLAHKYPRLSGYNFVANNPIMLVDPDGREISFEKVGEFFSDLFKGIFRNLGSQSSRYENQIIYPSSEELKKTFGPDAIEKVYSQTEQRDFAKSMGIDFSEKGQEVLAGLILGTILNETEQTNRKTHSGRIMIVYTALADETLLGETFEGIVPGTWKPYTTNEYYPETSFTLNPGLEGNYLPRVNIGNGKSIIYSIKVYVVEEF